MPYAQIETILQQLAKNQLSKETSPSDSKLVLQIYQICVESVCKTLLQFCNSLLENMMYPRGTPNLLVDNIESCKRISLNEFVNPNGVLGHPLIFEVIAAKDTLAKLLTMNSEDYYKSDYVDFTALYHLQKVKEIIQFIYERLHQGLVIKDREVINRNILNKFEAQFVELDEIFNQLAIIFKESNSKDNYDITLCNIDNYIQNVNNFYISVLTQGEILNQYTKYIKSSACVEKNLPLQKNENFVQYVNRRNYVLRLDERKIFL